MPVKLPSELEEEILTRVPCKSLVRFRTVCKTWNSLILDHRFVRKNFDRTSSYGVEHRFVFCFIKISSVGDEEQKKNVVRDLTLRYRREGYMTMKRLVHCDGLLLSIMENQLLVWNPLLKETRWIKCASDFHQKDDFYSLGFTSNYDYRILKFRCAINIRSRPQRVEVYEFTSMTWKVIDTTDFDWFLRVPLCMVCMRGTPYWISLRDNPRTAFVQSFDFTKERFQPLEHLPFKYVESNPIALEIFKGDRLSVLEQCFETGKVSVWVKHLPIPSWTRLIVVTIPHLTQICPNFRLLSRSFFVDKNTTLFITSDSESEDGISITRVNSDKDIETNVTGIYSFCSCTYIPSLIRIPGFRKQDTSRIRLRKNRFK